MPLRQQRRVLGGLIFGARLAGIILILLALLTWPGMQTLTGRYTGLVNTMGSMALLLMGGFWLFGVTLLIRFFDDYLSRN